MYTNRYKYSNQSAGQNYHEIKANCLRNRSLFEDTEFPANNTSIFGTHGSSNGNRWAGNIFWKRPMELVRQPQFITDGVSRFDVIQGELGNCWLIAAVANLTMHQGLFVQVVPAENNSFRPGEYCGAFHFRFWQYGTWVSIIIDDRLPCDRHGELLFLHSSDKREFWSALLEKAYAKLHGCYSSLSGGTPSEALQDFSGGIIEVIDIEESNTDLFYVMKKAYDRSSLITCVLSGRRGYHEEKTREGLVRGHAYSVTSVQQIRVASKYNSGGSSTLLIRIRNPWGDHFEWNGAWSDSSREWELVDPSIKAQLGVTNRKDGEFWMSIYDFQKQFSRTEICHLSPDPVDAIVKMYGSPWNKEIVEGTWIRGVSAGGCLNHSTFATNPQYFFNFEASDEDGDADKCTVIVSLIQKMLKRSGTPRDKDTQSIGFRIFKVNALYRDGQKMDMAFFKRSGNGAGNSGAYTNTREVSARFELPSANYCIVPSTYEPHQEGEFLLRVFSEPSKRAQQQPYQTLPQQLISNQGLYDGFQNLRISTSSSANAQNGCPYPTSVGISNAFVPPLPTNPITESYPSQVNTNPYPASPYSNNTNPNTNCPYPGNTSSFPAPAASLSNNNSCPYPVSPIASSVNYSNNVYSNPTQPVQNSNFGAAPPNPTLYPVQPALNPNFNAVSQNSTPYSTTPTLNPNFSTVPPPNHMLPYPPQATMGNLLPYPNSPGSAGGVGFQPLYRVP